MTALEDARDRLPEAATISRDLLDFLAQRGGIENGTVSPSALAPKLIEAVVALEARIIRIEEGLLVEDDGDWKFEDIADEPLPNID